MDLLLLQLKDLNEKGLFRSAELLGNFLISDGSASSLAETHVFFGDTLMGKKEFVRAMRHYRLALQKKAISCKASSITWKMAQCLLHLKEERAALKTLEGIPEQQRTLEMNMCMASLCRKLGFIGAAKAKYVLALQQNPYALEALTALMELGVKWVELQALYQHSPNDMKWLQPFALSLESLAEHSYQQAIESFTKLEKKYPKNLFLLNNIATCHVHLTDAEKALQTFSKIRKVDNLYMESMDLYASIMKSKGKMVELNKLSQDMVKIDARRPETLTTIAIYVDSKGQKSKALELANKALMRSNNSHLMALLLKGNLLLSCGAPEEAAAAYRGAYMQRKDLSILQGLVRAYLTIPKYQEALMVAKEAYKLMPEDPKALTLYGLVLSHIPQGREMARKALDKALQRDPHSVDAVLALVQLNALEQKHEDAVKLLEARLEEDSNEMLHTRLADLYTMLERYDDAMDQYQKALLLNPLCEPAKIGSERLEKLMRGIDPDEEEEEEADVEEGTFVEDGEEEYFEEGEGMGG
ncbi:hypothetical protein QOT17_023132 [Balamuthia mandrillaris]